MIAEIGEISTQVRGISYSQGDAIQSFQKDYVPILRANNITENGLNFEDLIYVPKKIIKEHQLLRKGDILIAASSGSKHIVGKAALVRSDICFSFGAFCKVIRPNKNIDFGYFSYFFQTPDYRKKISALSAGANINNLKNEHLNELKIPLPPLETQKKIAAILDKADELRKNERKILEKYDQLAQSVFLEMFGDPVNNPKGWQIMTGTQYCESISVGVVVRPASYYVKNGVPALRSLNIRPNRLELNNLVYFSDEDNKKTLSKSIIRENDVLIVRTGQPGTAAVVPNYLAGSNCIDLIITRPKKTIINPVYYSYFFNTAGGKQLVLGSQRGQIQKHFNIGEIRKAKVPIPPIYLQNNFGLIIAKIETQKLLSMKSLQRSEELFQSLLQRAFRGELV